MEVSESSKVLLSLFQWLQMEAHFQFMVHRNCAQDCQLRWRGNGEVILNCDLFFWVKCRLLRSWFRKSVLTKANGNSSHYEWNWCALIRIFSIEDDSLKSDWQWSWFEIKGNKLVGVIHSPKKRLLFVDSKRIIELKVERCFKRYFRSNFGTCNLFSVLLK